MHEGADHGAMMVVIATIAVSTPADESDYSTHVLTSSGMVGACITTKHSKWTARRGSQTSTLDVALGFKVA
jgi:hypothetical protein